MFVRSWPAAVDVLWRPNVHESDAPKSAERKVSGWAQRNLSAGKPPTSRSPFWVHARRWKKKVTSGRCSSTFIDDRLYLHHAACFWGYTDVLIYLLGPWMFKEIGWWVNPHAGPGTNDPAALPDHWIGTGIGCHSKTHLRIKFICCITAMEISDFVSAQRGLHRLIDSHSAIKAEGKKSIYQSMCLSFFAVCLFLWKASLHYNLCPWRALTSSWTQLDLKISCRFTSCLLKSWRRTACLARSGVRLTTKTEHPTLKAECLNAWAAIRLEETRWFGNLSQTDFQIYF